LETAELSTAELKRTENEPELKTTDTRGRQWSIFSYQLASLVETARPPIDLKGTVIADTWRVVTAL
jgi:hypothetical protein